MFRQGTEKKKLIIPLDLRPKAKKHTHTHSVLYQIKVNPQYNLSQCGSFNVNIK